MMIPFGTPLIDALAASSKKDKVVFWSPGFGLSEAADGTKYPYIFVGVATYHAHAMGAMQYIADDWKAKGKTGNPKVINLYYDNPAGRDPLDLLTPHPHVGRSWWYPQAPHVSGNGRQDGPGPRLVRGTQTLTQRLVRREAILKKSCPCASTQVLPRM